MTITKAMTMTMTMMMMMMTMIYQSPLSRPLADEPDEQVNVVHADYDDYNIDTII